jgi:hypothetical protein
LIDQELTKAIGKIGPPDQTRTGQNVKAQPLQMLLPTSSKLAKELWPLCFCYFSLQPFSHSFQTLEQAIGGAFNPIRPCGDMSVSELSNRRPDGQGACCHLNVLKWEAEFLPAIVLDSLPEAVNRIHLFFVKGAAATQEFRAQEVGVARWGVASTLEGYVIENDLTQSNVQHVGLTGCETGRGGPKHKRGIFVPLLIISIGTLLQNLSFGVWPAHNRCQCQLKIHLRTCLAIIGDSL